MKYQTHLMLPRKKRNMNKKCGEQSSFSIELKPKIFEFEENQNYNNNDGDVNISEASDVEFEERENVSVNVGRRRKRGRRGVDAEKQARRDELQRRIESLLSPILMSVPSYEHNTNNGIRNDNNLNDSNSPRSHRCQDFSKYPHPSYPCREKTELPDSRLILSSFFSSDQYFFYPRFKNQHNLSDPDEHHSIENSGVTIDKQKVFI